MNCAASLPISRQFAGLVKFFREDLRKAFVLQSSATVVLLPDIRVSS